MNCPLGRRALVWLTLGLIGVDLVTLLIVLGLQLFGRPDWEADADLPNPLVATAPGRLVQIVVYDKIGGDSWYPMLKAYEWKRQDPADHSLYDMLLKGETKFQYPPSSLLLYDLIPEPGSVGPDGNLNLNDEFMTWVRRLSLLALFATVGLAATILEVRLRQVGGGTGDHWAWRVARVALAVGLGLTFYPLVTGHFFGQIQTFLGCLIAAAILLQMLGKELPAGLCVGLCCLVKPQYGVILLWALLTRRWRFAGGLVAVFGIGSLVALARYGLDEHLTYVRVLSSISKGGEVYWPNQTVNGLMNRLLENETPRGGDAMKFDAFFAEFHPVVYGATLLTSLLILAVALRPWRIVIAAVRRRWELATGGPVSLMVAVAASTMASPIAWEHHYGTFLPLFAAALPDLIRVRPFGRWTGPAFLASYLAMACVVLHAPTLDAIFSTPVTGLLGSHLFFGAVTLFVLLLKLRSAEDARLMIPPAAGTSAASLGAAPASSAPPPDRSRRAADRPISPDIVG